jgi:hypothetical protein
VTGWDVLTGRASVPAGMLAELEALRAALPGYDVMITCHSPTHRFEAIRRNPDAGTWCVVSSDPADLWRELAGPAPPPAAHGAQADGMPAAARATTGLFPRH